MIRALHIGLLVQMVLAGAGCGTGEYARAEIILKPPGKGEKSSQVWGTCRIIEAERPSIAVEVMRWANAQ